MPDVDLYLRVSTRLQREEGTSLASQERACRELAQRLGLAVACVHAEDFPGDTLDRPLFERLRERIRAGQTHGVIVYDPDRLARSPILQAVAEMEFDRQKVSLHYVTEPSADSPEAQLVRYIKGYAAQIERLQIRERTMRGRKERALRGMLPTGGGGLYGYRYNRETGRREIDEDEAVIVRMIYRWVVEEDASLFKIIWRLREMGIPSPGGSALWSQSTVQRLIKNEAYKGVTYSNKYQAVEPLRRFIDHPKRRNSRMVLRDPSEWIPQPGVTPALVDPPTWEHAQRTLHSHLVISKRNSKHEYLLKGRIYCGICGHRMYGTPTAKGLHAYRCHWRRKEVTLTPCDNRLIGAEKLDREVWAALKAVLLQPEIILAEVTRRRDQDHDPTPERLADVETRIRKLRRQEENLVRHLGDDDLDQEPIVKQLKLLKKEREGFEAEKTRLEEQRRRLGDWGDLESQVRHFCERAAANIEEFTYQDKLDALEAVEVKVYVDRQHWWGDAVVPLARATFRDS
jgi:site-specific DNA recombinase